MKKIKLFFDIIRAKYKKLKELIKSTYYLHFYYKEPIDERSILFLSKYGDDLAGNMLRILKEVTGSEYSDYHASLIVAKDKRKKIEKILETSNITNVELAKRGSRKAFRLLATSKFIFMDSTMIHTYVKKEGQVIVNTWHGTPLKKLGVDNKRGIPEQGNTIRTIHMADYLVFPSEFMKERMTSAYELDNLYKGTFLLEGYPRNSVFFDDKAGAGIREQLGIEGKEIFVYMPTWRGSLSAFEHEEQIEFIASFLTKLDSLLTDNQILYVKFHPFVGDSLDVSSYTHIKSYPSKYDVYDFLNISDGLVTDYSSIFFDYANKGKKIILFPYDEVEYSQNSGLYFPVSELPFPRVYNAEELAREISSPKNYDDREFIEKFCTYDRPNAEKYICEHVIKGNKVCKEAFPGSNGKENVLIYMCNFIKNGIVSSFLSLINSIDTEERNYYMCFEGYLFRKKRTDIDKVTADIGYLPWNAPGRESFAEHFAMKLYYKHIFETKRIRKLVDRYFDREIKYNLMGMDFSYAINYVGYNRFNLRILQGIKGKRMVYVHNDMVEETNSKKTVYRYAIRDAYENYDTIVAVSPNLKESICKLGGSEDKIVYVDHFFNKDNIVRQGKEEASFAEDTISNYSLEEIVASLDDKSKKTIVTCGRFSPEKNHMAFIRAFEKFAEKHSEYQLLIIGGYGVLCNETMECANNSKAKIMVIKSLDNPHAFISKCHLFMLPSLYEGLGLVLLEADALGLPVVSTDIVGPRDIMKKHGGYLVEPTEEGLISGMEAFEKGEVPRINVDLYEYNRKAREDFAGLFK